MSVDSARKAIFLEDEDGNTIGVILDGAVYRLETQGKILNPSGTQMGDATTPVRTDPTGTTTQPVSDAGGSLTVDDGGSSLTIDNTNLDAALSTLATETKLEQVRALLSTIDADTSNLDVALSTRAAEHATAGSPHAARLTDGTSFYNATTPADTQPVSDAGGSLTVDQATYANLKAQIQIRNPGDTVNLGDATNPIRIDPTGTTTQPTSNAAASQADGHSASIGATTDADTADTLIGRVKQIITRLAGGLPAALVGGRLDINTGAWLGSTSPTVGQKAMSSSVPTVIASDQSEVASKNAATSQVDGHSVTIGTTTDLDTANTLIGRTKQIITRLAGGLPASLSGSGNLQTTIVEPIAAGTNEIGFVGQGTRAAASGSWPVYLANSSGNNVTITNDAGVYRVEIQGKVQTIGAAPPPATTGVLIYANNPLTVGTSDTDYTIPNGDIFRLQEIVAGNEDPTKGAVVSVYYYNGTEHLVARVYTAGFTIPIGYPDVSEAQDGTSMVGNGTTFLIRVRRQKYSGSDIAIVAQVAGYVV